MRLSHSVSHSELPENFLRISVFFFYKMTDFFLSLYDWDQRQRKHHLCVELHVNLLMCENFIYEMFSSL